MRRHDSHGRRTRTLESLVAPPPDDVSVEPQFALGTLEMMKVESVDDEADELLEIVHDLKNPLGTISLEMSLLNEYVAAFQSPDVQATLTRIQRNLAYLERLVQDILDSKAMESGSFSLQRSRADLGELIQQVIERSVATRDRARLRVVTPERVKLAVDSLRIERVIANLVHNALKYAPGRTDVVVRLERTATHARVLVIDRGPGIAPEDLALVFERYHRTEHGRQHEGSGLGLYIARRIVEAHGGSMGVQSIRDRGSSFYFELPLA